MAQSESDQILSGLQGNSSDNSGKTFLGVPSDYTTKQSVRPDNLKNYTGPISSNLMTTVNVPPQYVEGDQHQPAAWSPDDMASLQRQLYQAGLLSSNFRPGAWDDVSDAAYKELLIMANRSGATADAVLQDLVTNPLPSQGSQRTITTPDPNQVRQQVAQGSQSVLGRVDTGLVESVANDYSAMSTSRQQAAATGNSMDIPDAQSYGEAQARLRNPTEAGANDYLSQFQNFMKIIGFDPTGSNNSLVQ